MKTARIFSVLFVVALALIILSACARHPQFGEVDVPRYEQEREQTGSVLEDLTPGFGGNPVYAYSFAVSGKYHFVGTSDGVYRASDRRLKRWEPVLFPTKIIKAMAVDSRGRLYAGTYLYGVRVSDDYGESWRDAIGGDLKDYYSINCIVINACGHVFIGTSDHGVFRSMNRGQSWTQLESGLTRIEDVRSMAIGSDNEIYVGTSMGMILSSADNGDTWTSVSSPFMKSRILCLAIDPEGTLIAGTEQDGVFRSSNKGRSWIPIVGFPKGEVRAFAVDLLTKATFVAIYHQGVWSFYTHDAEHGWAMMQDLPMKVRSLFAHNGYLYAGTDEHVVRFRLK